MSVRWHGIQWHAILNITYKHDVTCVPFQRDSPAATADFADDVIRRRLKVGISYLLSSWANGHFWFCRSAWECFFNLIHVWLIVCLFAFLLLCHICVSAASLAEEKRLAFQIITLYKILVTFVVYDSVWLLFLSLSDLQEGFWCVWGCSEGWQRTGHFHIEFDESK